MKKFRTVLFNGYHKEEVDGYLEELEREMNALREDAARGKAVEELNARIMQLESSNETYQKRLNSQTGQLESETAKGKGLAAENERLIAENERLLAENRQLQEEKEKLKKYEKDYSDFMDLMVNMKAQARQIVVDAQSDAEEILHMAKKDADGITAAARTDAEKIAEQAKNDAETSMQKAEADIEKMREEEAEKFKMARYKISGYLDSLNRSQNKLIEVYEEFGNIVDQLPLRIGDVFSEEAFELLDDPKRDENDGWMRPEEQAKEEAPYSSKD